MRVWRKYTSEKRISDHQERTRIALCMFSRTLISVVRLRYEPGKEEAGSDGSIHALICTSVCFMLWPEVIIP